MTRDDALRVVIVALAADGGCYWCARECMKTARRAWPDFDWDELVKFTPEEWPGSELEMDDARSAIRCDPDD